MAYPAVAASQFSYRESQNTDDVVELDELGLESGDLIVVAVFKEGAGSGQSYTFPEGWSERFDATSGAHVAMGIGTRVSDGTETTVTVTSSVTERFTAIAVRVTGWHGTTAPETTATPGTGASDSPDPAASPTASWGAEENLFLTFCALDSTEDGAISSYPTNYTHHQVATDASVAALGLASNGQGAVAARQLTAASDDPDAFVWSFSEDWLATTMVIRPAAGGGGEPSEFSPAWARGANVLIQARH